MKILLFGKNGQVGWELQRSLAPLGELFALDSDSDIACGDFTNLDGIRHTIRHIKPQIIVNAAAYTAVDKAESEVALATTINAQAPCVLAEEAKQQKALLVHYSTDYVFNGSGHTARLETDTPDPINIYGKSKLAGDIAIQNEGGQYLIFRTSWVYGARGNNFAKTMLRLAQDRDKLTVINDQIGTPTGAELLADITAHAILQVLQTPSVAGLYHLTASGETSWYEYACFVINMAKKYGLPIKIASDDIEPIATTDFVCAAQRPLNSRLNTQKLQNKLHLTLPHWQFGVERMLIELIGNSL